MIPTSNRFGALAGDGDPEVIIEREMVSKSSKHRIPPITIFNKQREEIIVLIKQLNISSYSLKNLRHALHIYCESSTDFKMLQDKLMKDEVNCYSHDLKEDKYFKIALEDLH